MFLKKRIMIDEKSNVRFINGVVSFGNIHLNVYCFETDGVLIDTGGQVLLHEFQPFFRRVDVDRVVITHFHEDHVGGAAFLQKEYNLPIYLNEMMVEESGNKADYPFYRKFFWGKRRPFQAKGLGQTFTSRNAVWDVIETPGHAEDHVAFLNQETGQLFSGDLYVQPKTRVVLRDESIPAIIQSLQKVLTYEFDELFCCHAGYVKEGRQAITNKLHYLQELQERVLTLQQQGYNEKEIHKMIFKKKYPITYLSLGEWGSIHIVRSILNY